MISFEPLMATPNLDNEIVRKSSIITDTPEETVSRMLVETWAEYSEGARITDYLSVLVAPRLRAIYTDENRMCFDVRYSSLGRKQASGTAPGRIARLAIWRKPAAAAGHAQLAQ
jgi:hypothetical protein